MPAAENETSFFDGIDVSVNGIATLATGDTKFLKDGLAGIAKPASDAMQAVSRGPAGGHRAGAGRGLEADARADRARAIELAGRAGKERRAVRIGRERTAIREGAGRVAGDFVPDHGGGRDAGGEAAAARRQSATDAAFAAARAGRGGGPTFTIAIPGQSFGSRSPDLQSRARKPSAWQRSSVDPVRREELERPSAPGPPPAKSPAGKEAQWRFDVTVPPDAALTRPYFTRPDEEQPYYDLIDARYRNLPTAPYPLAARARLLYHGVPFEVAQVVQTSERVPGIGTIAESAAGRAGDLRSGFRRRPARCRWGRNRSRSPARFTAT